MDALAAYCPDLEQWPKTWMYEARDLVPGRQVVEIFRPFLRHLLGRNLSGKTLRKHRDNLWLLGGEIISDLHKTPGYESGRWRKSFPRPSTAKVARSSPIARPKTSNARSIQRVESSTASSKTVRTAAEGL